MRKPVAAFSLVVTTLILSCFALLVSLADGQGKLVHAIAGIWAKIHLWMCGIRVNVEGEENIKSPPYVIMCNHQSALDIFSLLAAFPVPFRWVAKQELFRIPFFGWAIRRAGYISIDRDNPREALKAIDAAAQKIRLGLTIVMFPEGTRSKDGILLPFKKGSFSLVARAGVPLVPVGIINTNRLQPPGDFVPRKKGVVYIKVGRPILSNGDRRGSKERLMNVVRENIEGLIACQGN